MSRAKLYAVAALTSAVLALVASCDETPYRQGQAIYEYKCANCHMDDGSGLVGNIPPLAGADWLSTHRDDIACVIRNGMQGPMEVNGLAYSGVMRGYPELSDAELTNVANYILTAWGNDEPPLPASRVPEMLDDCEARGYPRIKEANPQQLGL